VTFENNIIFNMFREAVKVQSGGFNSDPFVFRNNTVAFTWDNPLRQGSWRHRNVDDARHPRARYIDTTSSSSRTTTPFA